MRIGFSGFRGQLHYDKTTGEVRLTGTLNDDPKDDTFKLLMPRGKKFHDHHHHANKRHAQDASMALHRVNELLGSNKLKALPKLDQLKTQLKLLEAQKILMNMFVHEHLLEKALEDILKKGDSIPCIDNFYAARRPFLDQHKFIYDMLELFDKGKSFFKGPIEKCIKNYTLPDIFGLKLVEKSAGKNKADKNKVGKNKTVQRTIEMDICLKEANT